MESSLVNPLGYFIVFYATISKWNLGKFETFSFQESSQYEPQSSGQTI